MALGKEYSAKVKNVSGILMGVSQIRVGLPSVRPANYVTGTATVKAVQQVPNSTVTTVTGTDGTTVVNQVVPSAAISTAATYSTAFVASGVYSGAYDGAYIIRYGGTAYDIYGPDGKKDAGVSAASITAGYTMKIGGTAAGAVITGTCSNPAEGMTWIVPVWSANKIERAQAGIICPYSLFSKDINSIGGLKDAKFTPKVDTKIELSSGFPSTVDDTTIVKTSVGVSFEAYEYTNANLKGLKDMISSAINDATTSSIAVEMVGRTKGGTLNTWFCPTCTMDSFPEISPKDDYSSFTYQLSANKPSEISSWLVDDATFTPSVEFNTLNALAPVYREFTYLH